MSAAFDALERRIAAVRGCKLSREETITRLTDELTPWLESFSFCKEHGKFIVLKLADGRYPSLNDLLLDALAALEEVQARTSAP